MLNSAKRKLDLINSEVLLAYTLHTRLSWLHVQPMQSQLRSSLSYPSCTCGMIHHVSSLSPSPFLVLSPSVIVFHVPGFPSHVLQISPTWLDPSSRLNTCYRNYTQERSLSEQRELRRKKKYVELFRVIARSNVFMHEQ